MRMPPSITDIGSRVELVPLDPHFHDISIALYEQRSPGTGPGYVVHSYSSREGAAERLDYAARAMRVLGGMTSSETDPRVLRFTCGSGHLLGCKRIFLEACKIPPGSPLEPRPLTTLDRKTGMTIAVTDEGGGTYRVTAEGGEGDGARRIAIAAGGLARLGQMHLVKENADRVGFDCGHSHDALVGLLLTRALNVRAVIRELEDAAARGVLAAPSSGK